MKVRGFIGLLTLVLCTCAPAPPSPTATVEVIEDREAVIAGAYQSLDAAVLDRLLTPDFTIVYAGSGNRKDRAAYLSDLASLRQQFPPLSVSLDSLEVAANGALVEVSGIRRFSWETERSPGRYAERYRNEWRWVNGEWKLAQTTLLSTTAH